MAQNPKRPRDPKKLAKAIVDIATGELTEDVAPVRGAPGGHRRAELLPQARRVKIAKRAASTRWSKAGEATEDAKD